MAENRTDTTAEEGGEEEPAKGGNYGLPFGLCARYGIHLPRNATPRDAWNALKKRGVNPPWTEKGKGQYDEDGKFKRKLKEQGLKSKGYTDEQLKGKSDGEIDDLDKKFNPEKNKPVEVKTRDEAHKVLVDNIGFKLVENSFNGVDEPLVISNTNQLSKLEVKFGAIHKSRSTICAVNYGNAEAYVGSHLTNPLDQNLSLCPRFYKSQKDAADRAIRAREDNWSMPFEDNEAEIYNVTHEYGHIVANTLIAKRMEDAGWDKNNPGMWQDMSAYGKYRTPAAIKKHLFAKYYETKDGFYKDFVNEINEIAKESNPNFVGRDNISVYGLSSTSEAFAEIFANSQLSRPNEYGKAMQIWLERKGVIKNANS